MKLFNQEMSPVASYGYEFAKGALKYVCNVAIVSFIIAMVLVKISNMLNVGVDDSDLNGSNRSGFRVLTDYKTGIQYLSDGKGGLIRREQTNEQRTIQN